MAQLGDSDYESDYESDMEQDATGMGDAFQDGRGLFDDASEVSHTECVDFA